MSIHTHRDKALKHIYFNHVIELLFEPENDSHKVFTAKKLLLCLLLPQTHVCAILILQIIRRENKERSFTVVVYQCQPFLNVVVVVR